MWMNEWTQEYCAGVTMVYFWHNGKDQREPNWIKTVRNDFDNSTRM